MKNVIICGNGGLLQYVSEELACHEDVFIETIYMNPTEIPKDNSFSNRTVLLAVSWHDTENWIVELKKAGAGEIYRIPVYVMQYRLPVWEGGQLVEGSAAKVSDDDTDLLYLETHVADTCNLKCKGCMHFSNLAVDPNFPDLSEFEKDFKRLSKLFSNIFIVRLMGGEPLLNQQLGKYIEIVRKYFPAAELRIASNGLLIPRQKADLWEAMRTYHAAMDVGPYTPTLDKLAEILAVLDSEGIPYGKIAPARVKFRKSLTLHDNNDPAETTALCGSGHCHFLRNGEISKCPLPLLIGDFNSVYGTRLESEDVFNIYEEVSGRELRRKLEDYADFCSYCPSKETMIDWEVTKGNAVKEDWIAEVRMSDKEDTAMRDTDKQIEVLKRILAASDEEAADYKFIYNCIAEYGVYPFEPLKEYYSDCNYTENGMMQVPAEFANFCCFISKWRIDSAIEIGVYRGRSSYLICALLYRRNPDLIYDMVDICDRLDEYERFAEVLPALRKRIPCTSNDFKGREYDFVFIDADHSYDGSILDYMNVGRFAKKLLCFHDIYAHECDSQNGGTVRMWKEVQNASSKSQKVIFSQFPDRWMGIGVCVNMFDSHMGYASDIEDLQKEIEKIKEFLKIGKEIFIYGARVNSKRLWKILRQEKTDISGFMISDNVVSENPDIIDEKQVVALSAVDIRDREVFIVIPLSDGIAAQISAELINRGMEEDRIYKVKERVLSHWFYGID